MRSYLLENAYSDLNEKKFNDLASTKTLELVNESPTPEQEWLGKNIISPLQRAIDGINVSRSHIPTFISREDVRKEADKVQVVLQHMLEIWHNIQDVCGTTETEAPAVGPVAMDSQDALLKIKKLKGTLNPHIKGDRLQVKFPTVEATKEFVDWARISKLDPSVIGTMVQFNSKPYNT